MMKVIHKAWSYSFAVTEGDKPIAQAVDLTWWRDKGELRIQDDLYTAWRDLMLFEDATQIGSISPDGLFNRAEAA